MSVQTARVILILLSVQPYLTLSFQVAHPRTATGYGPPTTQNYAAGQCGLNSQFRARVLQGKSGLAAFRSLGFETTEKTRAGRVVWVWSLWGGLIKILILASLR